MHKYSVCIRKVFSSRTSRNQFSINLQFPSYQDIQEIFDFHMGGKTGGFDVQVASIVENIKLFSPYKLIHV